MDLIIRVIDIFLKITDIITITFMIANITYQEGDRYLWNS